MRNLFIYLLVMLSFASCLEAQTLQDVMTNGNTTTKQLQHSHSQGIRLINSNVTPGPGVYNALLFGQYGGSSQYMRMLPIATDDNTINWGTQFSYDFTNDRWFFQGDVEFLSSVFIDKTGFVGIGTTTPLAKLHIYGQGGGDSGFRISNSTEAIRGYFNTDNSNDNFIITYNNTGGAEIELQSDGDVILGQAGNVGIGSTDPSTLLEIESGNQPTITVNNKKKSSSWGIGESYGEIIFSSDDGSGLGAGTRSYIKSITPQANGANSELIFGTRNGSALLERLRIDKNGNVGIGTTSPDEKLTVKGTVHAEEVKVDLSVPGPDYVFEPDYDLRTLEETAAYIKSNKHLPEIPSAKEMEANGIQLGEMNMLLLKKIEELTLYQIEQQELIKEQQRMIDRQSQLNSELISRIEQLENE